jgi:hypothetical protein
MGLWMPIITCVIVGALVLFRLTSWGARTHAWLQSIIANQVDTGQARLSDFISLASISLTIVGVLVGWFTVKLQTQKATVEERAEGYEEQIATSQHDLADVKFRATQLAPGTMLRLTNPTHDRSVIGSNLNLAGC